jgi:diacylglycerol kinase
LSKESRANAVARIARSFGYAFEGVVALLQTQPNAWIHVAAAALAILLGIGLRLSPPEMAAVILAIGLVFAAESANTAIESLADLVSPEVHPLVKRAKDVAAAGVLISAVCAVGVALSVFLPRLLVLNR